MVPGWDQTRDPGSAVRHYILHVTDCDRPPGSFNLFQSTKFAVTKIGKKGKTYIYTIYNVHQGHNKVSYLVLVFVTPLDFLPTQI